MKCYICSFEKKKDEFGFDFCSDFCSDREYYGHDAYPDPRRLKVGEFGYFPCSDCGCTMEGDYKENEVCSKCWKQRRFNARTELLREALKWKIGIDLRDRIEEELEK